MSSRQIWPIWGQRLASHEIVVVLGEELDRRA